MADRTHSIPKARKSCRWGVMLGDSPSDTSREVLGRRFVESKTHHNAHDSHFLRLLALSVGSRIVEGSERP